jgi:hypothetical protein
VTHPGTKYGLSFLGLPLNKKPLHRNIMHQQTVISVQVTKELRKNGQFSFEEFPSLPFL